MQGANLLGIPTLFQPTAVTVGFGQPTPKPRRSTGEKEKMSSFSFLGWALSLPLVRRPSCPRTARRPQQHAETLR